MRARPDIVPAPDAGARPPPGAHRGRLPYRLAFSASVAGLMSVLIGGAIALIRSGPEGAVAAWAETAPIAFAVAFPTSLLVIPFVQALLDRLFEKGPSI